MWVSDPDPDPDYIGCVYVHGGKLDSNPDSDQLSHMDTGCEPDSNPDSGPGACVNTL